VRGKKGSGEVISVSKTRGKQATGRGEGKGQKEARGERFVFQYKGSFVPRGGWERNEILSSIRPSLKEKVQSVDFKKKKRGKGEKEGSVSRKHKNTGTGHRKEPRAGDQSQRQKAEKKPEKR